MPEVDVMDMSWIGVPPAVLGPVIADPSRWRNWWPDLDLAVAEDRGVQGVRWLVGSARRGRTGGRMAGSMELYLHPTDGGTLVYYFLRLDGTRAPIPLRRRDGLVRDYRARTKRVLWALADTVDHARLDRVRSRS